VEFSVFVDVLEWARYDFGYDVPVATCGFQEKIISTFNIPVLLLEMLTSTGEMEQVKQAMGFPPSMHYSPIARRKE